MNENYLRLMWTMRLFEERVIELHTSGEVVGSVHLGNGQEAIAAGACAALDLTRDAVFVTYRGHSWALACGVDPAAVFAELMGRETGVNGGRGGSAYFSSVAHGFYGENSIVGGHAPIAVGAALAARYDGSGRVALAVFGDGALNQGSVHEAMNMASAFGLPVIFLVENNGYSELTPIEAMVRKPELYRRGEAYGIDGVRIDGNDPVAVHDAIAAAATACRAGQGPALIEAMTERLVGHYIGDAQVYRPRGEVDRAREREPIAAYGAGAPDRLEALRLEALAAIDAAVETARRSPPADPTSAREHLYA
jgi:TPP-dependent pyruvate/acetoin dehydrogenase alpha subunit